MLDWARKHGLVRDFAHHRFIGFNNPDPSPGRSDYGYEQWMTVGPAARSSGGVEIKRFPGGQFLATRCPGLQHIRPRWQDLFTWCQHSPHIPEFERPYLEECLTPFATRPDDFIFRLCLPVRNAAAPAHTSRAA